MSEPELIGPTVDALLTVLLAGRPGVEPEPTPAADPPAESVPDGTDAAVV